MAPLGKPCQVAQGALWWYRITSGCHTTGHDAEKRPLLCALSNDTQCRHMQSLLQQVGVNNLLSIMQGVDSAALRTRSGSVRP